MQHWAELMLGRGPAARTSSGKCSSEEVAFSSLLLLLSGRALGDPSGCAALGLSLLLAGEATAAAARSWNGGQVCP